MPQAPLIAHQFHRWSRGNAQELHPAMEIITTIIPIFIIILLGWIVRKRGMITPDFQIAANRLVFYLSIPALIFNSIAKAPFHEQFDALLLLLTLAAAASIYAIAFLISRLARWRPARAGAFIQSSGHGNLGYIGLPIAYYYLGDAGLAKAAILCAFLAIFQNLLSVWVLQAHDETNQVRTSWKSLAGSLIHNPVIIGAAAGIAVSGWAIPLPRILTRALDIMGDLAPPMALLLIGASLSIKLMRRHLRPTLGALGLKLIALPSIGLLLFHGFGFTPESYLPALILLCCPTATIAFIMTRAMHSDSDFAVATISASTLFSSLTFMLWLATSLGTG